MLTPTVPDGDRPLWTSFGTPRSAGAPQRVGWFGPRSTGLPKIGGIHAPGRSTPSASRRSAPFLDVVAGPGTAPGGSVGGTESAAIYTLTRYNPQTGEFDPFLTKPLTSSFHACSSIRGPEGPW